MKIAIIGASGFVGSALLKEALNMGHIVTAIVRDPSKILVKHANLVVERCNVYENDNLTKLLTGKEAVLGAFNPGWTDPDIYADFIKGYSAIVDATKKAGVKRILIVGGAGSLEIKPGVQLVDTPEFPDDWKQGALGARDYLNILKKETNLDWTFLSPAIMLKPGERTGKFRIGTDNPIFNENGESTISVKDLALALINEMEKPQFIGKRFTVGY